jgi:RNA polymerase sigma-70 factor (ECF subfamily)
MRSGTDGADGRHSPAAGGTDHSSEIPPAERAAATLAMDLYAKGDNSAFEQIYDLIAPRLHGFLVRQTREPARAEDLLQQTMLQIHRSRGSFIPGADVIPWAFAIARRLFIDGTRRQRTERLRIESEAAREPEFSSEGLGEELCLAKQLAEKIEVAFAELPENQRVAYQLIREEGLSLSDAAEVLGTSVMAVKLRLHRAQVCLRAAAEAEERV